MGNAVSLFTRTVRAVWARGRRRWGVFRLSAVKIGRQLRQHLGVQFSSEKREVRLENERHPDDERDHDDTDAGDGDQVAVNV